MGYATFDSEKDIIYRSKEELLKKTGISIPDPILPPKKLVKLTGTLSEFKAIFCQAPVGDGAYMTAEQKEQQKNKLRTGAASAMLVGNTTTALAALGRADGEDRSNYLAAMYMTAKLNDSIILKGWIGFYHFDDGDQVEVVAEKHADYYEVYAVTKPAEQIVCLIPPCAGGRKQALQSFITMFIIFYMLFTAGMIYVFASFTLDNILTAYGSIGLILGLAGIMTYGKFKTTFVVLAEQIFTTLGWQNVEYINLRAMTKRHIDDLIKQGQDPTKWDYRTQVFKRPYKNAVKSPLGLFYYRPEEVYKKSKKVI